MATVKDERLFSPASLRRAWVQVRRNGSSPGVDGVSVADFASNLDAGLEALRRDILNGSYRPSPVRRFYVAKASGKNRPLSVWTVRDRIAQRVVLDYLTPLLEEMFLPCSYGFRPGRSTEDAVRSVQYAYKKGRRWVVDADIRNCFDSIPPDLLIQQVGRVVKSARVTSLIQQWLHTPIKGQAGERAGVSQGSVLSPLLANLYLHRFDQMIFAALPGVFLVRFADDFVMLFEKRSQAEWGEVVAGQALNSLGLELNEDKTRVVHFQEGFAFLGMAFRGSKVRPIPKEN